MPLLSRRSAGCPCLQEQCCRWHAVVVLFAAFVSLLAVNVARGQIKEDRPRLFINSGGPAGNTNFLAFSPDTQLLFAGGLDKVAHAWNVQAPGRPRLVRTLRWEFARGFLGAINAGALAKTPEGLQVAVGGVSARNWQGDIVIASATTGEIVRVLPGVREQQPQRGHRASIVHLDWSPSGTQLLSVSEDGEVRVWAGPNWTSRVLVPSQTIRADDRKLDRLLPAIFLDENTVVVAKAGEDVNWSLQVLTVSDGAEGAVIQHRGRVTSLARQQPTADGNTPAAQVRWASADTSGYVYTWQGGTLNNAKVLRSNKRPFATALSYGTGGQLAVATYLQDNTSGVELWDVAGGQEVDAVSTARGETASAVTLSLDGKFLATQSHTDNQVLLFPLTDATGQPLAKPLSTQQPQRLIGGGQSVFKVAFTAEKNYRLAFGQTPFENATARSFEYGPLERAFDVHAPQLLAKLPGDDWRKPITGKGNWTMLRDDNSLSSLVLVQGNTGRGTIRLDPQTQGEFRCFCWIPGENGQPQAIAIGTNIQHGVFVYQLPINGRPLKLVRYFRDHQGAVMSLSVSHDGRYLASGSADQTIKIWSLSELNPAANFPNAAGWGADLQQTPAGVQVTKLMDSGIAQRRGLEVGDVITTTFAKVAGKDVMKTQPAEMYRMLVDLPLMSTVLVKGQRAGQAFDWILMVPAWEPLLTLYVDRQGEWALWTPEGYYDSSVARGGELFGWQINRGPGQTPRVLRAAELEKVFERPQLIRKLLQAGSIPAAFRALGQPVPANLNTQVASVAARVPEVQIVTPQIDTELPAGQVATLSADVTIPLTRTANEFVIRAFVNGVPLTEVDRRPDGNKLSMRWEGEPPDKFNRFKVIVEEKDGGLNGLVKWDEVAVASPVGARRYRVHLLAIAANDYIGRLKPLRYAVPDAESILELVREKQGAFYSLGEVRVLMEDQVTRENIENELTNLQNSLARADAHDLLVIYIAGHGYAFGPDYYFIPPNAGDFNRETLEDVGVSWSKLKDLANVPCRKLVLLDTCRAGNALLAQDDDLEISRRGQLKAASGPLKRSDFLVVTATGVDEDALEGQDYGGHGAFTWAILQALQGKADGADLQPEGANEADGVVAVRETIQYVQSEVQISTGYLQQPTFTPAELFELTELPLVRVAP